MPKQKKAAENITSRLNLVMKSGKYTLGLRSTLKVRDKNEGEGGVDACMWVWVCVLGGRRCSLQRCVKKTRASRRMHALLFLLWRRHLYWHVS